MGGAWYRKRPRRLKPHLPPIRIYTHYRQSSVFSSMTKAVFRFAASLPTSASIGPQVRNLSRSGVADMQTKQFFWDAAEAPKFPALRFVSQGYSCNSVHR